MTSNPQHNPTLESPQPIPCAACGYNIAGLTQDGSCPECDTLNYISIRTQTLWSTPPTVRRSIRLGCILLAIGNLCIPLSCFGFLIISSTVALGTAFAPAALIGVLFILASFTFIAVGAWLGTQQPDNLINESSFSARLVARTFGTTLAICTILIIATYLLDFAGAGTVTISQTRTVSWLALFGLGFLTTALTIEWIACLCDASTAVLKRQVRARPFGASKRIIMTIMALVLGPIGGVLVSLYTLHVLYDFERLSGVRLHHKKPGTLL